MSALGKKGLTKTDYDKQICTHIVWSPSLTGSLDDDNIGSLRFSLLAATLMSVYMMQVKITFLLLTTE